MDAHRHRASAAARGAQQGRRSGWATTARASSPTGTSRATRRTSASRFPDAPGKYFYVWLDAPVGYLASLKAHLARAMGIDFAQFLQDPRRRAVSTSSARTSSISTRCSGRRCSKFAGAPYKVPDNVFVHGFITCAGEKMSKSRGTGISPDVYLDLGLNPEWLRYYIAAKLNDQRRGHRLQSRRFRRARQQRPDRQVRQHRQPRGDASSPSTSTATLRHARRKAVRDALPATA